MCVVYPILYLDFAANGLRWTHSITYPYALYDDSFKNYHHLHVYIIVFVNALKCIIIFNKFCLSKKYIYQQICEMTSVR